MNKIYQDLTKDAKLHYVFDMAREVVQQEGQIGRIWNGGLPKEWLDNWRKKIQIPKPKELYIKYSNQQKEIQKNNGIIMAEYKKKEIMIEEQEQKIEKLKDQIQEWEVRFQDLEDRKTEQRMKHEMEIEECQQRTQRWMNIAQKWEKQIEEERQSKKEEISEEMKIEKENNKVDESIQLEEEDFEMNAYDMEQSQTQRFNRRRYLAKWLDNNRVQGNKDNIERWKKMRNKYWNIDCLGKSDLQKDIIINKKGWIYFSDELKKCYKSYLTLEWNGWTYIIKIRKINFINKKYITEEQKVRKESQDEWQELDEFDEIYF